jgi:hypothetical protein
VISHYISLGNIAPDEATQKIETGYDAKRDRWNGYDRVEHKQIYEEYEAVEAERQRLREEEIDKQTTTDMAAVHKVAKADGKEGDPDFGSSNEEDADEDKCADAADAVGQKMDTKTRITVWTFPSQEVQRPTMQHCGEPFPYHRKENTPASGGFRISLLVPYNPSDATHLRSP